MTAQFQAIPEWHDVSPELFQNTIIPLYRPAILRGFVNHWPIVQQAKNSRAAMLAYLQSIDSGGEVDAIMLRPETKGRVFYNENMDGFHFLLYRVPIQSAHFFCAKPT